METYTISELVKSIIPFVGIFVSACGSIIIPILLFRARSAERGGKILWKRIDECREEIERLKISSGKQEGKFEMLYNEHTRIGGNCGR
jgi:hypothetical protein